MNFPHMQRCAILAAVVVFLFAWFALTAQAQVIFPARGGTGTSTIPTLGQLLVGQANGSYAPQATSTLGISTTDITEGLKLFYTDARVGSYITASSTPLSALLNYWTKSGTDLSYSSGNVSIGTATPATVLDVQGAAVGAFPANSGTSVGTGHRVRIGRTAGGAVLDMGTAGAFGMWLQVSQNTDLALQYPLLLNPNGGNVGIGTNSPDFKVEAEYTGGNGISSHSTDAGGVANFYLLTDSTAAANVRNWSLNTNYDVAGDFAVRTSNARGGNPYSAGTTRFVINAAGNVGIGTTTPNSILSISGSNAALTITDTRDTTFSVGDVINSIDFRSNDASASLTGAIRTKISSVTEDTFGSQTGLAFATHNGTTLSEKIRITNAGNVGIGTTNPVYVGVGVNTNPVLTVAGPIQGGSATRSATALGATTGFFDINGWWGMRAGTDNSFNVDVYNAANPIAALTVLQSGNVGIGTTNPGAKLDVQGGNIKTSGTLTLGSNELTIYQTGFSVGMQQLYVAGLAAVGGAGPDGTIGLNVGAPSATARGLVVSAASAATADIFQVYGSGSALRFNVTAGGNVGIGTAAPPIKLTVDGSGAQIRLRDSAATRYRSDFSVSGGSGLFVNAFDDTASVFIPITIEASRISLSGGNVGIGTTSPAHALDLFSTATTTMRVDSSSISQGSCLALKDSDGVGYTYVTANNGVLSASVTPCS